MSNQSIYKTAAKKLYSLLEKYIYFIISLLSLIMLLIVFLIPQGDIRDFTLNLSSEFLGASLVFLLVNLASKYNPDAQDQDEQKELLENISAKLDKFPQAGINLSDRRSYDIPFERLLENTNKVDFLGVSLVGVVVHYEAFLVQKAQSGCKMRFLLIDPESLTIGVCTGFWDKNPENRKADVRRSIRTIKRLADIGNVELRTTRVSLPYSIIIKDKDTKFNQANVQVELYGYGVSPSEQPHFALTSASDETWYTYFVQQYEKLWNDGKPFDFNAE